MSEVIDGSVSPETIKQVENNPISDVLSVAQGIKSQDPKEKLATTELVNKKIEADKEGHVNTHTQWAPFVLSVLSGNLGAAYKYWNGGPTRQVEAYNPTTGRAFKEYNQNGVTGRIFDANGNALTPEQIKKIDDAGGLISKEDTTAMQTGGFKNASEGYVQTMTGLRKPVLDQYAKSSTLAKQASGLNNLIEERIQLAKNATWMDAVAQLKPSKRQELFSLLSTQATKTQGTSAETTGGKTVNIGGQKNVSEGENAGAEFGTGVKPGQAGAVGGVGIPPAGLNAGGTIGGSNSSSAGNQVNVGERTGNVAGSTQSSSQLGQANIRSQIEGIINSKIGDKEFSDLQRYIQLTGQIDAEHAKMDTSEYIPGVTTEVKVDPMLSGRKNSLITDFTSQKNNAMTVAFNKYLATKLHQSNGEPLDASKVADEFMNTNVAKGIAYRFDNLINEAKTGKVKEAAEGDIAVDARNKPHIRKNGKWEPLND
jgi:hypothetical protein